MVAAQDSDSEPVECDLAKTTGGLGLAEGQFATVLLELPANQQRPVPEVNVAPAQSDQGDQPEQRVEAVLADGVEDRAV